MIVSRNRKYKTADGRDVVILSVDGPGKDSVIGYLAGTDYLKSWWPNGAYLLYGSSALDLVEQPEEVLVAVRVARGPDGRLLVSSNIVGEPGKYAAGGHQLFTAKVQD